MTRVSELVTSDCDATPPLQVWAVVSGLDAGAVVVGARGEGAKETVSSTVGLAVVVHCWNMVHRQIMYTR